jgi:hypothetical protein
MTTTQTKQVERTLPNIYGRKKSRLTRLDGTTINTYESRREARKARAKECELKRLKLYETRIVVMEQLPDTRRSTEENGKESNGKQQDIKAQPKNGKRPKLQKHNGSKRSGRKPANGGPDSGPGSGRDSS